MGINALHVPIKPDGMEGSSRLVANHWFFAAKPKRNKCYIICEMFGDWSLDSGSSNLLPSQLVPIRLDDVIPGHLAEHAEMVGESDDVVLFAAGNAVFGIDIMKTEGRCFFTAFFASVDRGAGSEPLTPSWLWLPKDHHP